MAHVWMWRLLTPKAVKSILTKEAYGLVHVMMSASLQATPLAAMARPVAGVCDGTVVVTLPGSPKGARENLAAILHLLPHACELARGASSRQLHAQGVGAVAKELGVGHEHQHQHQHPHHHHHHHLHHHHAPVSNSLTGPVTKRNRTSPYPMISMEEAWRLVEEFTPPPAVEVRQVDGALCGHVVADDVVARESVPAYRASIVDGYAVRSSEGPGVYPVGQVSLARRGDGERMPLLPGHVARVTTGGAIPDEADAVVMVEDTRLHATTQDGAEEREVEVMGEARAGQNVREVGSDVQAGQTILAKGTTITSNGGELGLLVSTGALSVPIYRRPIVGVLSTGDEVCDHKEPIAPGQVRDSNRPTLLSALAGLNVPHVDLGHVADDAESLRDKLTAAFARCDIIVSTGGVSMGEKDLLKPTIEQALHGVVHFGRVAMKPGKPTTFATCRTEQGERKLMFALPGNPASAMVTLHLFVMTAVRKMSGSADARPRTMRAVAAEDFPLDPRPEYQRVHWSVDPATAVVKAAAVQGGQRSSRIGSFLACNGLAQLPALTPERGVVRRGEFVDVIPL